MKTSQYLRVHSLQLFVAVAICAGLAFGMIDPASAMIGGIMLSTEPGAEFEIIKKALAEHGLSVKQFMEKYDDEKKDIRSQLLELQQKMANRHVGGGGGGDSGGIAEMTELIMQSDQLKAFLGGSTQSVQIKIPLPMFKTAILNATGSNQPLVAADRRPGIVFAPQRRFTIRDLFSSIPTNSNMVEFCRELAFTNNAAPQGSTTSPDTATEGEAKAESAMTFELAQAPVITIAHWIPASRQVLSDAPALQRHVDSRLLYGLKLEEEDELLNGTGANGKLNGLINNATAFSGGSTNLSPLDTLALGIGQLAATEYEPTGFILNPVDWWSDRILLKKNTQGNYILGDPAQMTEPRLWGLPVAVTNTMPQGKFLCLDAGRTGYIADRADATVRIAEQHSDYFTRNLVAILCEERLTLVIEKGAAMIYGDLQHLG